jgi:hypothetical protein
MIGQGERDAVAPKAPKRSESYPGAVTFDRSSMSGSAGCFAAARRAARVKPTALNLRRDRDDASRVLIYRCPKAKFI